MKKLYLIVILTCVIALFGLYASGVNKGKEAGSADIFNRDVGNNSQAELKISGMTCGSCVQKIENALKSAKGTKIPKVSLAKEKATVYFDPKTTSADSLVEAINKLGKYHASISKVKNNKELMDEERERIEKSKQFAMSINGKEITNNEFESLVSKRLGNFRNIGRNFYPTAKQRYQIVAEVANSIIDESLIEKEIGKEKFDVADSEVGEQIEKIKKYYRLDDNGLKESLKAQGLDLESFKIEIKKELRTVKYLEAKVFPPKTPDSKKNSLYQRWISELQDKADIKIFSSEISEAFVNNTKSSGCGGSCCSRS